MTQPPNSVKHDLNNRVFLRKDLIQKRMGVEDNLRQQWDKQIGEHLLKTLHKHQLMNSIFGVFSPIKAEPQLNSVFNQMHELGISLALPLVIKKNMPLQFSKWMPNDVMTQDEYGISVPANFNITSPNVLLIPCVGFNNQGYRLGYGGGFYDRTLAVTQRPLAIGIAYDQSKTQFEIGEYDIPMDIIITEQEISFFNQVK
jgi:5-formyltetrahydrofolate cyclo-ligase